MSQTDRTCAICGQPTGSYAIIVPKDEQCTIVCIRCGPKVDASGWQKDAQYWLNVVAKGGKYLGG